MNERLNRFLHIPLTTATIAGMALVLLAPLARASGGEEANPLPDKAGDFALKVEPGVAIPVTTPQSQIFSPGGAETVKALWLLNRYLELGPSAAVMVLPAQASGGEAGMAWAFGGSLVVRRPHDTPDGEALRGISPWVDADAFYVRTGPLDRPGFALAVGFAVPVGKARVFWIGPFARYLQIIQIDRTGFDNHDAKAVILGLSLEVGSGVERTSDAAFDTQSPPGPPQTFSCPDRDGDGVPDKVDRCPDVAGPMDNWGCPQYKRLVVKPDKLELKEKIYFAWNDSSIEESSFPLLDEVVQALKDNKGFTVQVVGNASSEGLDDHNQALSEKRAETVLDYMVSHGIGRERLISKGFSSSNPLDTNATVGGRENNRRVEFVVQFLILKNGGN